MASLEIERERELEYSLMDALENEAIYTPKREDGEAAEDKLESFPESDMMRESAASGGNSTDSSILRTHFDAPQDVSDSSMMTAGDVEAGGGAESTTLEEMRAEGCCAVAAHDPPPVTIHPPPDAEEASHTVSHR